MNKEKVIKLNQIKTVSAKNETTKVVSETNVIFFTVQSEVLMEYRTVLETAAIKLIINR